MTRSMRKFIRDLHAPQPQHVPPVMHQSSMKTSSQQVLNPYPDIDAVARLERSARSTER